MYTMTPLADIPPSHSGFWFMLVMVGLIWIYMVLAEDERGLRVLYTIAAAGVIWISWLVSYEWTDQTTKVHKNEQVTGEFVQFVAEGWSESRTNGKTTRQVDVHKTYVVYRINGSEVLFEANTGTEYPRRAVFYKN